MNFVFLCNFITDVFCKLECSGFVWFFIGVAQSDQVDYFSSGE